MPPQFFNAGQQAQQQAMQAQQTALRAQQQAQQQAILAQQQATLTQRLARQRQSVDPGHAESRAVGANGGSEQRDGHAAPSPSGLDPRLVLANAREALERQDWSESADAFERLLCAPGYSAEALYGLGWIELQRGAADQAQVLFREATESDPGHANAWFALGRVTEERSVDEAVAYYRQALAAKPGHYGAAQRLRLLNEPNTPTPHSSIEATSFVPSSEPAETTPAPPDNGRFGGLSERGDLGVVEYLRRDNSAVARDALARIESLNRTSRFRFTAYLQGIVTRFVLIVVPAAVLAYILYHVTPLRIGSRTIHFYSNNSRELILVGVAIWGVWAVWTLLECVTNTVTIRNGRIKWTHGVLNKHTETLDVWTARDVELDRNLVQRWTGDGTLTFKGTTHDRPRRLHKGQFKPLCLTGVARADELEGIYAMLLDLKFLLRAHPGLKGIIQ